MITQAEGEKQQQINEAECVAAAILAIVQATVQVSAKLPKRFKFCEARKPSSYASPSSRSEVWWLAKASNMLILSASVSDGGSMIALAINAIKQSGPATHGKA